MAGYEERMNPPQTNFTSALTQRRNKPIPLLGMVSMNNGESEESPQCKPQLAHGRVQSILETHIMYYPPKSVAGVLLV
jgi:hypothetical protein